MKNFETLVLLVITVLVIGLMIGLIAGRHWGGSGVQLSKYEQQSADSTPNSDTEQSNFKININTATANELTQLPGIGEVTAQRIVEYRGTYGSFTSIYGLENVTGIGKKKVESIAQYITVGG